MPTSQSLLSSMQPFSCPSRACRKRKVAICIMLIYIQCIYSGQWLIRIAYIIYICVVHNIQTNELTENVCCETNQMAYLVYSFKWLSREFQTGLRQDPESTLHVELPNACAAPPRPWDAAACLNLVDSIYWHSEHRLAIWSSNINLTQYFGEIQSTNRNLKF